MSLSGVHSTDCRYTGELFSEVPISRQDCCCDTPPEPAPVTWLVVHRGGKAHAFTRASVDQNALCGMTLVTTRHPPFKYEQGRAPNPGFQCKICQSLLTEEHTMSTVDLRVKRLERQIQQAEAELARIESMPEDIYEDGDVVWFRKSFDDGDSFYTYAAIKAAGVWFTTGDTQSHSRRRWDSLLEFADWSHEWFEMWAASEWVPV